MPKLNLSRLHNTTLMAESGPRRVYGLSVLVDNIGFGLVVTSMTLYFTRVVHLSTGQVGLGLTIAGLVGLVAGIPIGDLADRRGSREMVMVTVLIQCLAVFSYLFIHDFAAFVVVASLETLAASGSSAASVALMRRIGGDDATAYRAAMRAIMNLGFSLGAVGCAVALQLDTPDAYRALIIANGLSFLGSWAILRRLPHYEPLPPPPQAGPRWAALSDKPFVAYTLLAGAMFIQYEVIMLPLPLWIVSHTHAPRWSVALCLLINTALVVMCQVRVGGKVETVQQGGAALRRAGAIFLVSCSGIGFAEGLPGWIALILLVCAITLHTFGELWFASGTFAIEFGLAPEHAQGQYEGLVGVGTGAGLAAAPVLLVGVCLGLGRLGWLGLGACLLLLGLLAPAVAQWGERTRPSPEVSQTGSAEDAGPAPTG